MAKTQALVLVAGATGAVGGLVARKLLDAGIPVRVIGRNAEKLASLASDGAQTMIVDLTDPVAVAQACADVGQVYSTVNNVMGRGASSPNRVDLRGHAVLAAAARDAGVLRFVYLSARGMDAKSPVDFFRVKHAIDMVVQASGVPFVLIQPTAFMETWVSMIVDSIRKNGTAVLFGNGRSVGNYIAIEDVAEVSARILQRPEIANEIIEIGGPSNCTTEHLVTLIESHIGVRARRRRIPTPVLRAGGLLLRPFNEVASRLMRMGYFMATRDTRFNGGARVAERFGVSPISVESFIAALPP